jgi:hypothetical protein
MMKKLLSLLALALVSVASQAACFGTGSMRTCSDNSGNNYTVQQLGNSTYMNGYNSSTGSRWSHNSQTFGNTTYINGNSNGRSWNQTIQSSPGFTTYSGTDTSGRHFNRVCSTFGCD